MLIRVLAFSVTILAGQTAVAEDNYRIAYSKKDKVEVFAKKKQGEWCGNNIDLVFIGDQGADLSTSGLQPLVNKLVKVLPRECPQLLAFSLTASDSAGNQQYEANADSASGWKLAEVHSEPVKIASTDSAGNQQYEANAGSASGRKLAEVRSEPVKRLATANAEPEQVTSVETIGTEVAPAEVAVIEEKSSHNLPDYSVNGWSPVPFASEVSISKGITDTVLLASNGCKLRYETDDPKVQGGRVAFSGEIKCVDGFLSGNGNIIIKRSDGSTFRRFKTKVAGGYILDKRLSGDLYPQFRFDQGNTKKLSVIFGYDSEYQAYYMANLSQNSGIWSLEKDNTHYYRSRLREIFVVMDDTEIFLDQEKLNPPFNRLLTAADQTFGAGYFALRAISRISPTGEYDSDDIARQNQLASLQSNSKDQDEYSLDNNIYVAENSVTISDPNLYIVPARYQRKSSEIFWDRRENYFYDRQQQRVQKRKEKLEMLERHYRKLARGSVIDSIEYRHGDLTNMVDHNLGRLAIREGSVPVRLLIQSDDGGNTAEVAWPYPMEVTADEEIDSDSWYIMAGDLSASFDKKDEHGLLMPKIEVQNMIKCQKDQCAEYRDALEIIRSVHNEPDWRPNSSET